MNFNTFHVQSVLNRRRALQVPQITAHGILLNILQHFVVLAVFYRL